MNSSEDDSNKQMLSQVEQEDRLSALPNSLLVSILSLLQVDKAASTSVLSHRWRHLWTQITHFRCNHWRMRGKFKSIMDRFFQQHTSPKIHGFDICIRHSADVLELETWLRRVCDLNVEKIRIENWCDGNIVVIPTYMFQCQSLVVLELIHGFGSELLDDCDSGSVNLPNLKELRLEVRHWGFQTVLVLLNSSIPLLEVLDLSINYQAHARNEDVPDSIHIPLIFQNLRWLSLSIVDGCEGKRISWKHVIDAPKLETLIYHGPFWARFNFVRKPCSLTHAKVTLRGETLSHTKSIIFEDNNYLQSSGLFHVIYSVRSLQIHDSLIYLLVHLVDSGITPRVHNLVELRIDLRFTSGFDKLLLNCLHLVPNLKIFVIWKHPDIRLNWVVPASVPVCLYKLEKFEVFNPGRNDEDFKVLKYILRSANVLERFLVHVYWCFEEGQCKELRLCEESQFCEELFSSHKSSKSCVIEFYGGHHHASTNVEFN